MANSKLSTRLKHLFILFGIGVLSFILPDQPLAEWLDISLKKIFQILLAVSSIQLLGIFISKKMNSHAGVLIYGLISGIISSTAFTLQLAKKSKIQNEESTSIESIGFLSATLAMLIQGLILFLITVPSVQLSSLFLFVIPSLITVGLLVQRLVHTQHRQMDNEELVFDWFVISKLVLLIMFILAISSMIKNHLGDSGLKVLSFLISLFELHGMIIANAQLMSNNKISVELFNQLVFWMIFAGYLSKIMIVNFLGTKYLFKKVLGWSLLIILCTGVTWMLV